MQKFKRKAVSIALSLAMLFSILPASGAFAADENQVQESAPQTEAASGEQLEVQSETEGGEVQTQEMSVPQLQYLYIDTPYLMTPDTQKIMVSFQDEIELESVSMVYENVETAEQYEVLAGEIQDATAVFSIDYLENSTAGSYHLLKVRTVSGGITNEIDLGEAGIDSRFGVNQECDTQPDAIVEEESTSSSARTVNEPGNPVNFLTYDEEGELVESESVEEAVEEAKTDVPAMASRAAETSEKAGNLIVVIDPGHGGYDPGAVGVNGAKEKDLTLKIAKYCKEELEKYSGVTVYMTRTTDTGLSPSNNLSDDLKKRVEYAKGKKADVLVSMHLNSTGLGTAHGAEVYYPNANYNPGVGSEGKNLASKIQKELVGLGLTDRGIKIRNSGTNTLYPDGSLQDYYALIWQSKRAGFPAIIVEHAFIDNTSDYNKYLSSDEKLKALGIADAKGIAEAYGFAKGQWIQNDKGWWYQYADGSYAKNTWAAINGAWYHFDSDGYMQTGWFTEGTAKYYLDPVSGAMKTGWQLINNKWYYFNGSGIMVTGWQWIGNTCYYFDGTGGMATDTWIGNDYVNSNGAWVPGMVKPGWVQDGRGWWYRHSDGSYTKSNWEKIEGQWYYFDAAGYMTTGWQNVGGSWYYMDGSGKMLTGWQTIGGSKYYLNGSGVMLTGWQWINSKCYYFTASGAMASNTWIGNDYVDASGAWVPGKVKEEAKWILDEHGWWYRHSDGSYTKSNWEVIGGQWYYFNAAGYMLTGWQWIGGKCYYFASSGAMASNTWIGNDYVDASGAWVPGKVKEEAKWILDGRGWWYRHSDGSYTKSNWEVIGGQWYYFDAAGYMVTGWQWIGGKCYYFASSGAMASNTWIGNDYVDASGAWVPGKVKEEAKWILDGRGWWYRHKDGSYTRSNWEVIGGQWYYFDADGYMVTGWIALGGTHYYLNTSGAMHKGWLKDNGTWYYLNPTANNFGAEGAMTRGYRQIDGVWYYFNKEISPEGAMTYEGVTPIMGATALGNKTTAVNKMVKMYMNSKRTYPSGALSKGGASNITQFCEILYEEAIVENVKPEVVFGQAMKETGYLQFGGDVKVEQFNFAGLGATGGVPGESFKDVRTGIRAQVQHLKAYASKDSPKNEIVDTRFAYVTRNCAPYVEWLGIKENPDGKGWATARKYGMSLMESYIKPIYGM